MHAPIYTNFLALTLSLTLLLSTASATTLVAPTNGACPGASVLSACLASTRALAAGCGTTDWGCLCQTYTNVVQCFASAGCPNDPQWAGIYSNQQSYCSTATIYTSSVGTATRSSTTPSVVSSPVASPVSEAGGESVGKNASATGSTTGSASKTRSASLATGTASLTKPNEATSGVGARAGSGVGGVVVVAVLGAVGALL